MGRRGHAHRQSGVCIPSQQCRRSPAADLQVVRGAADGLEGVVRARVPALVRVDQQAQPPVPLLHLRRRRRQPHAQHSVRVALRGRLPHLRQCCLEHPATPPSRGGSLGDATPEYHAQLLLFSLATSLSAPCLYSLWSNCAKPMSHLRLLQAPREIDPRPRLRQRPGTGDMDCCLSCTYAWS